jgi:hypothetical protein
VARLKLPEPAPLARTLAFLRALRASGASPRPFERVFLAIGIALCFFALYVARLCPTLSLNGDSAELVSAAALWGVPHPPGYPLFTAIGHIFVTIGSATPADTAFSVHLTSAAFHACAIAAVCMATFTLTRSLAGAAAAGFALGTSRTFMLGSLYAEVFPLNDLFFACLIALALALALAGERRSSPRDEPPKWLVTFWVCTGFSLSHHLMIVLAGPALTLLVARPTLRSVRGHQNRAVSLALALAAPLFVYALIPLAASRSPALSWGNVHDWSSLWRLVTRQDYGGPFSPTRTPTAEPSRERLVAFGLLVARSMGIVSLALAALGLGREIYEKRAIGVSLALAILVPGPLFAWANALGTSSEATLAYFERFTSMCHVPLAIAAGSGVAFLQSATGIAHRSSVGSRGARVVLGVALALWGVHGALRTRDVDLSAERRGIAFAHDLILGTPDRSLILLSGDEPGSAALYVCAVERACGNRIVLSPGSLFLPWKMAQVRARYPDLDIPWSSGPALHRTHELAARALGNRPVFIYPSLFERDPALQNDFSSLPDRLLFRLWPKGAPLEGQRAAFMTSARGMVTANAPNACEGCSLTDPVAPRPSQDVEIVEAYQAALVNHERAARELSGAGDLAAMLEASGRVLASVTAQGGGLSISR